MLTYAHMEVRGQFLGVCLSFHQDQIQADEFYPLSHPVGPQTHKTIMCVWWGAYLCHSAPVEVRGQLCGARSALHSTWVWELSGLPSKYLPPPTGHSCWPMSTFFIEEIFLFPLTHDQKGV